MIQEVKQNGTEQIKLNNQQDIDNFMRGFANGEWQITGLPSEVLTNGEGDNPDLQEFAEKVRNGELVLAETQMFTPEGAPMCMLNNETQLAWMQAGFPPITLGMTKKYLRGIQHGKKKYIRSFCKYFDRLWTDFNLSHPVSYKSDFLHSLFQGKLPDEVNVRSRNGFFVNINFEMVKQTA